MTGLMNRVTGRGDLNDEAHLVQSINDIVTTPLGTRVTVRDYGCLLPYLTDKPINSTFILAAFGVIAEALAKWEPRFTVHVVSIDASQIAQGVIACDLTGLYKPLGRVIRLENITLVLSGKLSS